MEKNIKILLVLGALITTITLFIDIYFAAIVGTIFIAFLMSMMIMQDSRGVPDIRASLKGDAKAILMTNKGNAKAVKIHSTLVPLNIEFDIPVLEVESIYEFPLTTMVEEVKIIITFQNEEEQRFSRSAKLSALEEEPDLLKPMIPLFKWK
jgi:hypothetical protein